jgi:drug/metabolite transporter (DMT)-like permease
VDVRPDGLSRERSDWKDGGPFAGANRSMNIAKAILLKLVSALMFALMSGLVRYLGDQVPLGQIVFFRSAFAILPVVVIFAWRRELAAAVRTSRPFGHVGRGLISVGGMFLNFSALARLPLAEATAISFAAPLITVALAALFLNERVRIYRWSAVGIGFIGVIVMLLPHLSAATFTSASTTAAIGALCALSGAFCNAGSVVQTRRLTDTETTSSIVFYFSLICAFAGLATFPFGWITPNAWQLGALIAVGVLGGLAHIVLTESYRYAPASLVAPFDYTSILWAVLVGYAMFGEVPTYLVFVGAAIVVAAGLFVIWRERQLGLQRARAAEGPPTAT